MNYRTVTIMAEEALGASGTKLIPILIKDPITALFLPLSHTVGDGERIAPELDIIEKIELVDGSDVLMSLSGTEMAALHFYDGHPFIDCIACNMKSDTGYSHLRHYFGRFFRDPLLAFDPTKFRNPQLKITWDATNIEAAGTDLTLAILAECFDEKVISPVGFLQSREYHSYAPDDETHKYIDLPTDLVIRRLFLQTKMFGYSTVALLTNVKLSEDNDKRIPLDIRGVHLENKNAVEFGLCHQVIWADTRGAAAYIFTAPTRFMLPALMNTTDTSALRVIGVAGGLLTITCDVVDDIAYGGISGVIPYLVYCIPFGDKVEIEDWYDVTKLGSLRLDIEAGTDVGEAVFNTILQQLRRY